MRQVLVKYCGGCNPEIDRSKIVREIKAGLPADIELVTKVDHAADLGIMMAGCTVNCLDREEIRKLAKEWIIVSSNYINLFPFNKDELSAQVIQKIMQYWPASES